MGRRERKRNGKGRERERRTWEEEGKEERGVGKGSRGFLTVALQITGRNRRDVSCFPGLFLRDAVLVRQDAIQLLICVAVAFLRYFSLVSLLSFCSFPDARLVFVGGLRIIEGRVIKYR